MKIYILLMATLFGSQAFSQEITPEAAKAQKFNSNGDPILNIIDPDGSKQGTWYYQNQDGSDVIKQEFSDNELKSTSVQQNGSWINSDIFQENKELLGGLRTVLNSIGKALNDSRQIMIICDANGSIASFDLLGNWGEQDVNEMKINLEEYLKQNSEKLNGQTIFFL